MLAFATICRCRIRRFHEGLTEMKKRIAAIAAVMFIAGAPILASAAEPRPAYKPLPNFGLAAGAPFPLDGLAGADGKAIDGQRLLGKRVLINFYTKHCPPCIREVPKLNDIMKRRGDLHVLAITPDSATEAAGYVKQHGLIWPVAANAGPLLFKQLDVQAFPAFALLDEKGRLITTVQANQLGGEDGHATVAGIEAWIEAQRAPATN
ncbi:TlpA family protein disulfide reductase [Roseateles chitinivorans]|uniref:TlpA family protein disulfide reductase n=1 Tax=Roseateles chitinivorans TaxID=2917965 RepID=UPI003D66CEDB